MQCAVIAENKLQIDLLISVVQLLAGVKKAYNVIIIIDHIW